MTHEEYMQLALEQAEKGLGRVNPNPLVGAVIVKEERIISRGYHQAYGEPHAERNALAHCDTSPEGATIYVNLEPCSHQGKTPPCTEALIQNRIATVVVGARDPNPLVAGKGIQVLREAGIEVIEGVLEPECTRINRSFFHYIKTGLPYTVMKYAMTLDGKTATSSGLSQWITGEAARQRVHQDRLRYSAIMVGVATVLADDPLLTCRIQNGRNPLRIICDTHLRTPLTSKIVSTASEIPTIVATCVADKAMHEKYCAKGCQVLVFSEEDGQLCLTELMAHLGKTGIDSILLEGGGTLNWSMLAGGHVNLIQAYIAPKLFGGKDAASPVRGVGVAQPSEAFCLDNMQITSIGEDLLIEGEVQRQCSPE